MTEYGYIEKVEALKKVCDACGIVPDREKENCEYKFSGCREYDKIIDISPADVRPVVHGEWVEYDDDYGALCCSVCEHDAPDDTRWSFCPYCGADMRGKE